MLHPVREFGSETPSVICVALRWNGTHPTVAKEERMITLVTRKRRLKHMDLRIYNLVPPSKGLGMSLSRGEFDEVEMAVSRTKRMVQRVQTIALPVSKVDALHSVLELPGGYMSSWSESPCL